MLVAIYNKLKVAYKRQCQREWKDNVFVYNHGLFYLFILVSATVHQFMLMQLCTLGQQWIHLLGRIWWDLLNF